MGGDVPTDHCSRVAVHDRGQIRLPSPGVDIGDIGEPHLIRPVRHDLALHQIDQAIAVGIVADRGRLVRLRVHAAHPGRPGQPANPLARVRVPQRGPLGDNPVDTHPALVLLMNVLDQHGEFGINVGSPRRRSFRPRVQTGPGHLTHRTHHRNRDSFLAWRASFVRIHGLDKGERHRLWLANQAARTTLATYRGYVDKHIRSLIGAEKIGAVDADILDSFYAELRRCRDHCRRRRTIDHRTDRPHTCDHRCRRHDEKKSIPLTRHSFHSDWNYTITPKLNRLISYGYLPWENWRSRRCTEQPHGYRPVVYTEAWLLLTSEIGSLCGTVMVRFRGNWKPGDDADNLAGITLHPGAGVDRGLVR
jgi:hypothetical protein